VNNNSIPNIDINTVPIGPSCRNKRRRKYPVTTGGKTKGKETKVSNIDLPGIEDLDNSHPTPVAIGKPMSVPIVAT
jgi:hypothetical protein